MIFVNKKIILLSKPGYNGLRYNQALTSNIQSKIWFEIVTSPHMYKDVMVMTNKYRRSHSDHYNQKCYHNKSFVRRIIVLESKQDVDFSVLFSYDLNFNEKSDFDSQGEFVLHLKIHDMSFYFSLWVYVGLWRRIK
jgi:hypothetical protein